LELAVYAEGGRRGFIFFPEGRGRRRWIIVADELGKVLVFQDTSSGSPPIGVLYPVARKDGMEGSGGAFQSFAEVVRSEGPVKLRCLLVERRELGFVPAVRLAVSEEVTPYLDYSVMEKNLLGKDLTLMLQRGSASVKQSFRNSSESFASPKHYPLRRKEHSARLPSAQGY
jgi:hypothetical protein